MSYYLDELEIVEFVDKNKLETTNCNQVNIIDILVLVDNLYINNDLLTKILNSMRLINQNIKYKIIGLNKLDKINNYLADKYLVFSDEYKSNPNIFLDNIILNKTLNKNKILFANNIKNLEENINLKKQLWHELKNFV